MNAVIYFCAVYLICLTPCLVFYGCYKNRSKISLQLLFSIIVTALLAWYINHIVKDLIAHPRPDLSLALFIPEGKYSFPSGHTAFVASFAFAMYAYVGKGYLPLFLLALLVGTFRVLAGVHHWYDILGAFLVTGLATLVIYSAIAHLNQRAKRRVK